MINKGFFLLAFRRDGATQRDLRFPTLRAARLCWRSIREVTRVISIISYALEVLLVWIVKRRNTSTRPQKSLFLTSRFVPNAHQFAYQLDVYTAPASMSNCLMMACPVSDVVSSGVQPPSSVLFTSAPASTSARTTASSPFSAAMCSGVVPPSVA